MSRKLGEVAAFEELVGSHGGMGGPQTQPFLLHPAELRLAEEPLVGAPAVHHQLRAWAEQLRVNEAGITTAAAAPAATARPRALRLVGSWLALNGLLMVLVGLLLVAIELTNPSEEPVLAELGGNPVVATVALLLLGGLGLAAGVGIWRRWRWAWMAALGLEGLAVLQLLLALASGGLGGLVSYGIVSAVVALAIFYYLTRPHVAAAFGRGPDRPRS